MPKYRKKPVVIEAFQMTRERRASNEEWPEWLHKAWNMEPSLELSHYSEGAVWCNDYPNSDGTDKLCVGSKQGVNIVEWNDWIIKNGEADLYACKPDIFEMTYEPVTE
uniref:Uncharacterized protein n=1 Tax=viral metagenome TaxID=1070528 RepID=A0A6H2A4Y6_9ZZZZ